MIRLETDGAIARLTLDRPGALNALDRALTAALEDAVERVAALPGVTVLLVQGEGRAFCAGNDLKEMVTLGADEARSLASRQAALMDRFAGLPQVTLAVVDGHALGGGCMLALAQDLRIASDRARFAFPEVTLGFNPAYGVARLLDVVGGGVARELMLTGRTVRAPEALRLGLVNRVVAPPTIGEMALAWAREIATSPAPGLAATKAVVAALRAGRPGGEPEAYAAALATDTARARLAAFAARGPRG